VWGSSGPAGAFVGEGGWRWRLWLVREKGTAHETDPELKGRWTDPPAGKWPFFGVLDLRRIGASRCLSVAPGCASVDSTKKNSGASGLVFCRRRHT